MEADPDVEVRYPPANGRFPFTVSAGGPVTGSVQPQSSAVLCGSGPESARLVKTLFASRVARLADVADIVSVLVPRAKVEPVPDVCHCPRTGQDPRVRVSVPEPPPVI